MSHGEVDFGPHPPASVGLPNWQTGASQQLTSPFPGWLQDSTGRMYQTVLPSRSTLNSAASTAQARQETVAAAGDILPIVYGPDRLAGAPFAWGYIGADLVVGYLFCLGEIDAYTQIDLDDKALPAGVTVTQYLGTTTQGIDATLAAAITGYTDTLIHTINGVQIGIAYLVGRFPPGTLTGFPRLAAKLRGRKVYDPRSGLTVYSDNPSLCTADFQASAIYGAGKTIDWTGSIPAFDYNDTMVGTEKRHTLGLTLKDRLSTDQWAEVLRAYAHCFVVDQGDTIKLVPYKAATAVAQLTPDKIIRISPPRKKSLEEAPQAVGVVFTDTTSTPWRDSEPVWAYASGLANPPRDGESVVRMPGVQRGTQANREAIERYNILTLSDLSTQVELLDDGVRYEVGDVVGLTDPIGLTTKDMRVIATEMNGVGHWLLDLIEEDPASYSDSVTTVPTTPDTLLPDPLSPPAVTGLTLAEEVYQMENGTYASRIRATWDAATYAYLQHYYVEIIESGTVIQELTVRAATCASGAVAENKNYLVRVQAVSKLGAGGAFAQANITPLGKGLIPGNVTSLVGFEIGGEVYLDWSQGPAIDIDIWRYEVRYGATSSTWATATPLDKVDALRYLIKGIVPAGTWRFFVKAIDSVKQESATAAYVDITVTLDPAALRNEYLFTTPALTNMSSYTLRPDPTIYYVTDMAETWASLFPSTMSTYTNPVASYHASGTSTWLSESYDFGYSLTGDWKATANYSALSGTATLYLELSANGTSWTQYSGGIAKVSARFARIRIEATGTSTLYVVGGTAKVEINAVARSESFAGVAVGATGVGATVTFANKYAVRKSLLVTAINSQNDRSAIWDNLVLSTTGTNSVDVYLLENSARVAGDIDLRFEGI